MTKKPLPRQEDVHPDHLVTVGGPVDRARVSLRVFGETLVPGEITTLLECQPSNARQKGDIVPDKRYHRVAQTGGWILQSPLPETTDVETQVRAILGSVTDDISTWANLTEQFRVDIYCGIFITDGNRGFSLSPGMAKLLADRGIAIGFDVYCL